MCRLVAAHRALTSIDAWSSNFNLAATQVTPCRPCGRDEISNSISSTPFSRPAPRMRYSICCGFRPAGQKHAKICVSLRRRGRSNIPAKGGALKVHYSELKNQTQSCAAAHRAHARHAARKQIIDNNVSLTANVVKPAFAGRACSHTYGHAAKAAALLKIELRLQLSHRAPALRHFDIAFAKALPHFAHAIWHRGPVPLELDAPLRFHPRLGMEALARRRAITFWKRFVPRGLHPEIVYQFTPNLSPKSTQFQPDFSPILVHGIILYQFQPNSGTNLFHF